MFITVSLTANAAFNASLRILEQNVCEVHYLYDEEIPYEWKNTKDKYSRSRRLYFIGIYYSNVYPLTK